MPLEQELRGENRAPLFFFFCILGQETQLQKSGVKHGPWTYTIPSSGAGPFFSTARGNIKAAHLFWGEMRVAVYVWEEDVGDGTPKWSTPTIWGNCTQPPFRGSGLALKTQLGSL